MNEMSRQLLSGLALAALFAAPAALAQAPDSLSLASRDSFRIGTEGLALCTAQSSATDRALTDMFDRGYAIVCRDAAAPVGQVYALRTRGGDPTARLAGLRADRVTCQGGGPAQIQGLGTVESLECRLNAADVAYRVYTHRAGNIVYVAEGLGGYDSALRLALRSVIEDRIVPGEISIAVTGAGDPVAFARAQAGALDRQRALAEAYRRHAGAVLDVKEAYANLDVSQQAFAAERDRVASLSRARDLARLGFDNGALSYLDLLDAEPDEEEDLLSAPAPEDAPIRFAAPVDVLAASESEPCISVCRTALRSSVLGPHKT